MSKGKLKLLFIENDAKRRAAYKKRKKGLLNKVSELTTLCGINACTIIYSKFDSEPDVWPSTLAAQQVISQFKHLPEMMKERKMLNQEAYLRERITKLKEQLNKQLSENHEKDLVELMFKCLLIDKRELDKLLNGDAKKKVILDIDEAQSNPGCGILVIATTDVTHSSTQDSLEMDPADVALSSTRPTGITML
ncbi:hypothetical protein M9H77_28063 [Catharanthus roseus]|uniref:Uncharacterized protein n=1 Tax=Catharanthus roseus TaxID=4058 RepID=A0ACC0AG61_CATRO|nr:hypothetical protein M9H77_28063 [Catharanthus roseus]